MDNFFDNFGARTPASETGTQPKRPRSNRRRATPEHRAAQTKQMRKIKAFKAALIAAGYDTAGTQAKVLGLSRSTAWAALNADHKRAGFSSNTVKRMLLSSMLPPAVRRILEQYVEEKLKGLYGQKKKDIDIFRQKIDARLANSHG
jgi:hypothetical protein